MFLFKQVEPGTWTVGHYTPDGKFEPESDHDYKGEAVTRVHYLNGGSTVPEGLVPAGKPPIRCAFKEPVTTLNILLALFRRPVKI